MKQLVASLIIPALLTFTACKPTEHEHDHDHSHEPPHGGAAVVLGDEAFHLEFVRDSETGTLTAYVMDGHLENFIRVPNTNIEVVVEGLTRGGTLSLQPIPNNATGETVGDTSQFSASAEWLKTATNFNAAIPSIEIRGQIFTNVIFNFPKGNE